MTRCSCVEDVVCGACMTGGAASTPPADDVREALATLHRPVEIEPSSTICGECSWQLPNGHYFGKVVEYPCPTLDALAEFRPRGTVTGTGIEAQADAWDAGYEAGAEDQANVEGHRYTPENTSWMVVTSNPHRATGVRS